MKIVPILCVLPLLAACAAPPARATEDEAFSHALTLVHIFVHAAAQSDDPQEGQKMLDDVLAGRNTQASRAFAGLLDEATADLSPEQRDKVASIGRDLAAAARKEPSRPPAADAGTGAALQARKDLNEMGLRYYDQGQFFEAVKRNDALAAELFVAARGVNLSAKGPDGRTAADIARANGNDKLAQLLVAPPR